MAAELPYMKLWLDRLLGSTRVQALPDGEHWWYVGLLIHQWGLAGRGLPNDVNALARLLKVPVRAFRRAWEGRPGLPGINQFFTEKNGAIFNDQCEEFYRQELEALRRRVEGGRKGGQVTARLRLGDSKHATKHATKLATKLATKPTGSIPPPPPSPSPEEPPPTPSGGGGGGVVFSEGDSGPDPQGAGVLVALRGTWGFGAREALALVQGGFGPEDLAALEELHRRPEFFHGAKDRTAYLKTLVRQGVNLRAVLAEGPAKGPVDDYEEVLRQRDEERRRRQREYEREVEREAPMTEEERRAEWREAKARTGIPDDSAAKTHPPETQAAP